MSFEILYVIFVVVTVLNYILLDIKVDKIKRESLDKDKVIDSLMAHNKALCKLNDGFKDHERRLDNIEELIGKCISSLPEKPEEPIYTCEDCKFYDRQYGPVFKCKRRGCTYASECNTVCGLFEKKESLDEDEYVVYADNVKVDISSKKPVVYKTDRILTYEECVDRISKLFLDGCIGVATMNELLERYKQ